MALPKIQTTQTGGFNFCSTLGFEPGCARVSTARQVPFENEVFVGNSQQDTHGEYENTQLEKS